AALWPRLPPTTRSGGATTGRGAGARGNAILVSKELPMTPPRALTQVTDGVWVATSRNFRTTSTIVANGTRALLVDPAWDPDELVGLAAAIDALGLTVICGFATHAHYDHLLWHASFGDPPRWTTAGA